MQAWLAKQASPSTIPAKTLTGGEAPKKNGTLVDVPDNSEREIYGFPDVRLLQGLVDGTKTSSSVSPSTSKSPVVSDSPFVAVSPSPAIPSVAAPTPEPSSPGPGTDVPAEWSEPVPALESEVTPSSETEKSYFIPDCKILEPFSAPEPEIEEPYSRPPSESQEPHSTPEHEIEKPHPILEPEIEELYSTPEPEIEESYSFPASEIDEPHSAPESEIVEPYSIPSDEAGEPYSIPSDEAGEPYSIPEIQIELFPIPEAGESVVSPDREQSESSEAPLSVKREDPVEFEDSPFSAVAPEADPSREGTRLPTPPSLSTSSNKTRTVTLEDIKKANKGVKIGVEGAKGKIGVFVPVGVTMKPEDAIIEVPDDVAVAVAADGGNVAMRNVQVLLKQQPRVTRRALQNTQQSMKKQGLSLTNRSSADISNSRFEGGTDTIESVDRGSSFHCEGCIFHRNIAQKRGGAILVASSSVVLENCTFSNNKAQYGGAVWMSGVHHGDETAFLHIRDSLFKDNKVENQGGSLWVKNANKVEVLGSRFSSGTSINKGGALVVETTRYLFITGSQFDKNEAKMSSGGAISIAFCSETKTRNSTINLNPALVGGSATLYSDARGGEQVTINNTRFNDNKAQNRGGAFLLQTTAGDENAASTYAHVSIDQSSFVSNTAANGGAIYLSSESGSNLNLNVEVKNAEFMQNSATKAGGGMYCGKQSSIDFESSLFQQNEAHTGKGCATTCGCSIYQKQTDSLQLQNATVDASTPCNSLLPPSTTGEANSSSNTVTYVVVVLAVLVALIIILVGLLLKNKHRFPFNRRIQLFRSLTSIENDAVSPRQDLSVPLNESTEDLPYAADASEASVKRWMGNYTYGKMDCPAPPRSTDLSQTGSVNSHFLSDPEEVEEKAAARAILMDDAFAMDSRGPNLQATEDAS